MAVLVVLGHIYIGNLGLLMVSSRTPKPVVQSMIKKGFVEVCLNVRNVEATLPIYLPE